MGAGNADLGKGGLDAEGVRWPEKVVLRGEAREVREWTVAYGRLAGEGFDKGRTRDGSSDSVTVGGCR